MDYADGEEDEEGEQKLILTLGGDIASVQQNGCPYGGGQFYFDGHRPLLVNGDLSQQPPHFGGLSFGAAPNPPSGSPHMNERPTDRRQLVDDSATPFFGHSGCGVANAFDSVPLTNGSVETPADSSSSLGQMQSAGEGPNGERPSPLRNGASPIPICRGCGLEIRDRHLLCLNRRRQPVEEATKGEANDGGAEGGDDCCWHERCLRCAKCGRHLGDLLETSCFMHDGRPYCRDDYGRLFGSLACPQPCSRCALPIGPGEFVFRAAGVHIYHLHCFQCSCCGLALAKGDQYLCVEDGQQLICQRDFDIWHKLTAGGNKFPPPGIPPPPPPLLPTDQSPFPLIPLFSDLDFNLQRTTFRHHHHHSDRSKKVPKRPRTILNAPQRKAFKLAFEKGPKPSRKVREQLARETGLSVRVVQVWFQNQRAKMKKERKREMDKQQQMGMGGSGCGGGAPMSNGTDSDGGGGREEEGGSQLKSPESGGSTGGGRSTEMMADDDSDADDDDGEEEEGESVASYNSSGLMAPRCIVADGAAGMDGAGMVVGAGAFGGHQQQIGGGGGVGGQQQNPIEKLYSMHQNYFAFV